MLQVAFGGYLNIVSSNLVYNDSPIYYEPGYNILFPLQLQIPRTGNDSADQIFILLRKRSNNGQGFEKINTGQLSIVAKDNITEEILSTTIYHNDSTFPYSHQEWDLDPTSYSPLVIAIENMEIMERHTFLDCYIEDQEDKVFTYFRLIVEDIDNDFYYININVSDMAKRNTASYFASSEGIVNVNNIKNTYVLISPHSSIMEVKEKKQSSFSYPLSAFFYKRSTPVNDEDFDFTVSSYSSLFISDNVSLVNIPGYKKTVVLLIDKHLYQDIIINQVVTYIIIKATGVLTENISEFKLYFRI